ncbi:phospholipid carrier-dependent glycosyltransferase [Candidatus Roizmanbacteria bacterium]|nr:phospholipid carrier-dependent glycosyltransferase [Candidatus Roizmanbacteria bacterium]
MKKYWSIILISLISLLSVGLFLYKLTSSPPCLNADEAANGYDAYSILKTGKDQYGNSLPLRLKSFGDYKLPLLTYLSIPFIGLFGLNEFGVRMVNFPFVLFFPFVVYLLTIELFNKKSTGVLAAFLLAFTPGLQLLSRQAHEGYLTAFFLTLSFYLFLKFFKKQNVLNFSFFILSFLLTLFGYHSSRLWAGFFLLVSIFYVFKKKIKWFFPVLLVIVISIFGATDLTNNPTRIQNLLFFKNLGFSLKINELRAEGGSRLIYNKLTMGIKDVTSEYSRYFSPQFLAISGDENYRFGFPGISPMTPVEYVFIFIGFYFLFRNKEKWRYLITFMFLFSPASAALSWAGLSVTRSIFIFIPALIISAYGMISLLNRKNLLLILLIIIGYLLFNFYSWDFYLNHYPKRATVIRSWQCGYKKLTSYVSAKYKNFDRFYVTKKNGQPYIFFLFYLNYPPTLYQQSAQLTAPDVYGFGQVESFDKFVFDLPEKTVKNSVLIGFPDDFTDLEKPHLKEIKVDQEEIFLIKEVR